jgi:hypothetical protein
MGDKNIKKYWEKLGSDLESYFTTAYNFSRLK